MLYGIVIAVLGVLLIDVGEETLGLFFILVGGFGILAGGATFVWKSPQVKMLQAIDSFLIALVFLIISFRKEGHGIFKNPLISIGFTLFMAWTGFDDLKEYWRLSKLNTDNTSLKQK